MLTYRGRRGANGRAGVEFRRDRVGRRCFPLLWQVKVEP